MTIRIGLTGPIACGKSTVARHLRDAGASVVDADELAREVVEPGQAGFDEVVAAFGQGVVDADGGLDRPALASIVFRDPDELRRLEAIVHPAVRVRVNAAVGAAEAAAAPAVVVEAIKLVEGGYAALCDEVWLVDCNTTAQRERLGRRGLSAADATARLATQAGLADRLRPSATRVIDTSGDITETRRVVLAAYAEALETARTR
jgi:dephospho-CoA kinase